MKTINIYLVHTPALTKRLQYMNTTIDILKKLTDSLEFKTNIVTVKEPLKDYIEDNIEAYNKKVKYEKDNSPTADNQFNDAIQTLNVPQICNIEKHRSIYNNIKTDNDIHFVIEDDVLLGEDYIENIKELFIAIKNNSLGEWDILFTCVADVDKSANISLKDSRQTFKMLLSKSSYFIKQDTAKKLYEYLDVYKYNLKTGISKFIWDNKNIKSYVLNKHTFIEGSKFGLFTSSVNNTNFLFQNSHFVELAKIVANDNITDAMLKDAENLYKNINKLDNPDILHTMGVLYFKRNDIENAKKYMTDACNKLKENNGYVSKSSDILNNAINIYQYEQTMLDECKKKKSKYS
jgi:GR25 family glycosyltransferase involved in LPS biosynthesis